MTGETEDDAFQLIAEGKEGSRKNPLKVDSSDIYQTEVVKLPKMAWTTSVKESAACYFAYNEVLFAVKPNGLINYANQEAAEKDKGKLRLDFMKDCFIKSLVRDLQHKESTGD